MYVVDKGIYRKVYERKTGPKYFIRTTDGKQARIDVTKTRKVFNSKPPTKCQRGRQLIPSRHCAKRCSYPRKRNPVTSRCKKM